MQLIDNEIFSFDKYLLYLHVNPNQVMKHSRIANIIIVLIFALLHFGVAVLSRALSYQDDIMLTILTITMVIIISMRNHTRLDAMAVLTLIATLSGYIIVSWLWLPIETLIHTTRCLDYLATQHRHVGPINPGATIGLLCTI